MPSKVEELRKEIEKKLSKFEMDEVTVGEKTYPLYVFDKDEDINLFEGFLYANVNTKEEFSLLSNYKPPVSGYAGRIGIIIYKDHEIYIKDYRTNKHIRKTISKLNEPFLKKLRKVLEEPKSENISALFSRSDVVEEFYVLYKKSREFLLSNIRGISEEERREEFVDNFMMQMLTLWYLQEKGFFNRDKRYFITKFMDLKQKRLFGGFESYYAFLRHFFRQISGHSDEPYVEDESIGKCVVIGPAVFLNGEDDPAITIPDKCFYQEGVTEKLVNLTPKGRRRTISEKDIDFDIPLLNLFESRDWVDGDIDEYVLGSLYEKLITYMERKKLGAFYTPEEITSYICKNTIEPYLVDRINQEFEKDYGSIDELINAGDREELTTLFDLLQNIKILDPAVGSAHFLESAINVLVDIYRKLRDRAKEVGIEKLEILVADEDGRIKPLNLLEIPEKEGLFEVYVKFFIILSRNIYGVDINPSALKVARARLFLTLARHFNVNAGVFIRFPNVHFNLREGNSLIGYVDVPRGRKETTQVTLDFNFEDHEIQYIQERIKVDDELKKYLPEVARSLKIKGDLVKEVEEMNRILASKKIKWSEFEKVLKTKEKLIRVLVASLNSRYAVKLNKLLREITELFNRKLDEKFAEEHGIDLDELRKIKTFHWIFEFPEVFLEKKGFDVVVENPPYFGVRTLGPLERSLFENLYKEIFNGQIDIYYLFIYRSAQLTSLYGLCGLIVARYFLEADSALQLREYLQRNVSIKHLVDFRNNQLFVGINILNSIILFKKDISKTPNIIKFIRFNDKKTSKDRIWSILSSNDFDKKEILEEVCIKGHIKQEDLDSDRWLLLPKLYREIFSYVTNDSKKLGRLCKIGVGIQTGRDSIFILDENKIQEEQIERSLLRKFIKNGDIRKFKIIFDHRYMIYAKPGVKIEEFPNLFRYLIKNKKELENRYEVRTGRCKWYELSVVRNEDIFDSDKPKIITPFMATENRFFYDDGSDGGFVGSNDIYVIQPHDKKYTKFILGLLNSTLIEFYHKNHAKLKRDGYYEYYTNSLAEIPVKVVELDDQKIVFDILSDYLSLLDYDDKLFKVVFSEVLDSLVYELYLKQKFIEDSKKAIEEGKEPIYPQLENGPFLIDLVAKYLKPIDYDSYAKLTYSIEPLSEEEKQRMEEMKENYLKIIKEVVEAIEADEEIMGLIERIKSHEWVRVIEGCV